MFVLAVAFECDSGCEKVAHVYVNHGSWEIYDGILNKCNNYPGLPEVFSIGKVSLDLILSNDNE